MDLGVFSLADVAAGASIAVRVHDIVEYGARADQLGLDVFGVGEHHTPRFAVASPAVVLAAIAARSNSITLTSTVSVLSVLDPVRLFQDFAQLDLISDGRAEITAGRSAYAEPFELFGVPIDEYDAVFDEKLDLLLALNRCDEVTWSGQFRPSLTDAVVVPRPGRELPIRLGVGGSPASAERAARLGLPMTLALLSGSPERARPIVDLFRSTAPSRRDAAGEPGIGIVSHFFVGETSQHARDAFYPHYRTYFAEGRGMHLDRDSFELMAGPGGPLVVGSAQEVTEKILNRHDVLSIDRFLGQIDLGGLPRSAVLDSMQRFADDVAPVVRRETASEKTNHAKGTAS